MSIISFTYLALPNLWVINKGQYLFYSKTSNNSSKEGSRYCITFSKPDEHSEPLFRDYKFLHFVTFTMHFSCTTISVILGLLSMRSIYLFSYTDIVAINSLLYFYALWFE